jgi:CRISPR-associated protein Cas2
MSSEARRCYVIAYDIPDDRRRTRIAKVLESYGDRLQYSVFIVTARPAKLVRMRDSLTGLVKANEDSIAVFDLGIHDDKRLDNKITYIGVNRSLTPSNIIVL